MSRFSWTILVLVAALCGAPAASAQVFMWVDDQGVSHFSDTQRHAGFKQHASLGRVSTRGKRVAKRAFDDIITLAGKSHGVEPALVKAVVHAESNFDRNAVSRAGAQGLMQLMPTTAASLGVDDPFDPWQNIYGGTRYLSRLIDQYEGDLQLALAAYNAGAKAVQRYGGIPPYRETRGYVKRVLKLKQRYDAGLR